MFNRISRLITAAVLAFAAFPTLRAEERAVEVLDRMDVVINRLEYYQADFYQRAVALTEILSLIDSLDRVSRTDVEKLFQDEAAMVREVLREGQYAMPGVLQITVNSLRAQVEAARVWLGLFNANARFRRGDIDGNGVRDISDAIDLLGYLFREEDAPTCMKTADVNDDGHIDISDTVGILFHLFLSDREIAPPAACGTDPTSDAVSCEDYAGC
jgi:hypothetical protein